MTDVIKLRSPSDGNGKDPNDTRNDPNYRDKLEEGIKKKPETMLEALKMLSATNRIDQMESNLDNEHFVFPEMALAGQLTLFYAKPNAGKTLLFLHFLVEGIADGILNGEAVCLCAVGRWAYEPVPDTG